MKIHATWRENNDALKARLNAIYAIKGPRCRAEAMDKLALDYADLIATLTNQSGPQRPEDGMSIERQLALALVLSINTCKNLLIEHGLAEEDDLQPVDRACAFVACLDFAGDFAKAHKAEREVASDTVIEFLRELCAARAAGGVTTVQIEAGRATIRHDAPPPAPSSL